VLIALAAVVVALAVLGIGHRRASAREDAATSSRAAQQRDRLRRVPRIGPAQRDEP